MTKEELVHFLKTQYIEPNGLPTIKRYVMRQCEEYVDLIKLYTPLCETDNVKERIFWLVNDITEYPKKCKICGGPVKYFTGFKRDYESDTCSASCALRTEESKKRRKETNLERYGVEHVMSNKDVQRKRTEAYIENNILNEEKKKELYEKKRHTAIERYGVEHPTQSEHVQNKMKQTCLLRYGVDHQSKSEDVKSKKKHTCLERYGVEFTLQAKSVRDKAAQTIRDKYGVEHQSQSEIIKEKKRISYRERYGVDHPWTSMIVRSELRAAYKEKHGCEYPAQNDEVKSKIKQTSLDRYNKNCTLHDPEIKSKYRLVMNGKYLSRKKLLLPDYTALFTTDEYTGSKRDHLWRHDVCGLSFRDSLANGTLPVCPKCFPALIGTSKGEQEIYDFVNSIQPDALNGCRNIIAPRELDILVPSKNIAFEYDGLYWHSFDRAETGEERKYHLQKTEDAAVKGVRLVHIFENEWKNKREIVESRIANLLGRSKKIGARKCQVVELDARTAIDFMEKSHIQGSCPSTVKLGLKYGDEIVAVMTFGRPRYNKDVEYELLRYSNALGCSVVGGASKLFKHFVKVYAPKSVISYSDRRWNTGKLYENIGFKFIENTPPSYYYVIPGTCDLRHRSAFMKSKLPGILGERFDPAKTESQNMFDAGYRRIWDCGTSKWLFTSS